MELPSKGKRRITTFKKEPTKEPKRAAKPSRSKASIIKRMVEVKTDDYACLALHNQRLIYLLYLFPCLNSRKIALLSAPSKLLTQFFV